ncbi:MAG: glycoside hydrolase family 5, partial [Calditrichaeota bacterium]|nr:glycoside hydrolase family 5 [Calditrichota bacterium]
MMKAIRIVLWLMLMSPALFCQGFLGVNGTAIVDDAGQPYMLRGYGLGGWLVPEGYMLHTPGYGSPTDIRNKIADLLGEQDTEEFYRRYRANYVNEQDIQQIADWGFNS